MYRQMSIFPSIIVILVYARWFIPWINRRRVSVHLKDPIRPPMFFDMSVLIFALLYFSYAVAVFDIGVERLVKAHAASHIARMVCLFLMPLSPPFAGIALNDPIAKAITGSKNHLDQELFFSGHTMSLWVHWVLASPPYAPLHATIAGLCIPALLLQGCHYSIDVFVIPALCGLQMVLESI